MTKPNLQNIFHKFNSTRHNIWKTPTQRGKLHPRKKQEGNLSANPKEESHTNIILPLTTKITGSSNHLSVIYLNIIGLNSPIKRHRLTDRIHKPNPTYYCIEQMQLNDKGRHYLKVKGWKTNFQ